MHLFPADCTCKVSIPLTTDTDSHGCNGEWVGQLGIPAMVTVENSCGTFNGYESAMYNGAHLGTYVLDGMFAGDWVYQLKLTAAFNMDPVWDSLGQGSVWGIATYGDCAAGASFSIFMSKGSDDTTLYASIELMTSAGLVKDVLNISVVSKYVVSTGNTETVDFRSGDIRKVLIFARKLNSRIEESRENDHYRCIIALPIIEIVNS